MKTSTWITAIFLLFLFSASCTRQTEKPDFAVLEAEVKDMFTLSIRLFEEKNLEGLVGRFTSNGTLKLPDAPVVKGHEALRNNYSGVIQLEDFSIQLNPYYIEISESGDMAYALADFQVAFTTPVGPFSDQGTTLMVFKRVDGEWKIAAENLSSGPDL
jgi:ketosteroid isomerase-like protein